MIDIVELIKNKWKMSLSCLLPYEYQISIELGEINKSKSFLVLVPMGEKKAAADIGDGGWGWQGIIIKWSQR